MTGDRGELYCRSLMGRWQSKAAFVIQFGEDTNIEMGRLEGRIEHIASYRAARFQSVDELLAFVARMLAQLDARDRNGAERAAPGAD